jgi:hypothetical protein
MERRLLMVAAHGPGTVLQSFPPRKKPLNLTFSREPQWSNLSFESRMSDAHFATAATSLRK